MRSCRRTSQLFSSLRPGTRRTLTLRERVRQTLGAAGPVARAREQDGTEALTPGRAAAEPGGRPAERSGGGGAAGQRGCAGPGSAAPRSPSAPPPPGKPGRAEAPAGAGRPQGAAPAPPAPPASAGKPAAAALLGPAATAPPTRPRGAPAGGGRGGVRAARVQNSSTHGAIKPFPHILAPDRSLPTPPRPTCPPGKAALSAARGARKSRWRRLRAPLSFTQRAAGRPRAPFSARSVAATPGRPSSMSIRAQPPLPPPRQEVTSSHARRRPPCRAWRSRAAILVAGGLAGQGGHLGGETGAEPP